MPQLYEGQISIICTMYITETEKHQKDKNKIFVEHKNIILSSNAESQLKFPH